MGVTAELREPAAVSELMDPETLFGMIEEKVGENIELLLELGQ